jgi:C1A family cysteine protease
LTLEEFSATHLGLTVDTNRTKNYDDADYSNASFADSIDWVAKGAVSPIKNQASCGSCWAFSTVGAVEGHYQIAGNPLTQFSEENLVSCDNKMHGGSDNGCHGGLMDHAFAWIKKNGLCTERDYPYAAGSGIAPACKTSCAPAVTLTGFTDVRGEAGMIPALAKGPVSVAVEADKSAFHLYKSGVLDSAACGKKLDHGILAVGYGTDEGRGYYKVKNSWGTTWGESGYIRLVQGKDMCGIADSASYPTGVKKWDGPGPGPAPGPSPSGSNYKCNFLTRQCTQDAAGKFPSESACKALCL